MRYFNYLSISILLLLTSNHAYAIPSPDLVINLTASLAQVLGMASVLVGGFFMSGKRSSKSGGVAARGRSSKGLLIAVLAVLCISACFNIWQYTRQADFRAQQLSVNLHRKAVENGKELGGVSLKTLSFSQQIQHPRGLATNELEEMLAEAAKTDSRITLIDVREDEEVESGRIAGATHIRYPDLLQNSSLLDNASNVVLLCYSGNRSSELTAELASRGVETKFMVGGYEKWMTEGRALDVQNGSRESLREIPAYPNRDKLLETAEVHELVQEQDATFIDVRYPSEFQSGHLPGAINLTVRAEPTLSLAEKISSLPQRPLIGACYDRRSCFYSQILGLKLSRAGYEFAGRYTVPHEYLPASGAGKQHVNEWMERNQASLIGLARIKIGDVISRLIESTGQILLVLLALVVAVRIPLLPLFIKAERDRLVQKRLVGEVDNIKKRFSNDPVQRGREIQALHRANNIKPIVTLVGSLLNLGLLLFLFSVVNDQSAGWTMPVWWAASAAEPDTSHRIVVLIAALVVALGVASALPLTKWKVALIGLGAAVIGVLVVPLSMAVNVYLVVSLTVVLAQMGLVWLLDRRYGWSGKAKSKPLVNDGSIVPLSAAHIHTQRCGKKAARLGELIAAGFTVPDGFVVPLDSVHLYVSAENRKDSDQVLAGVLRAIRAERVAVRSSGTAEDGDNASFAGVYDSILNVDNSNLADSIQQVAASLDSGLQSEYARQQADAPSVSGGGALVQRMVPAEYAGVVFTEHPESAGKILVEMIEGLGESLVSGQVSPESYAFGRRSFHCDDTPSIDLTPLLKTVVDIEAHFGKPQDIEWAYSGGEFYILQARDITRSVTRRGTVGSTVEAERSRLLELLAPGKPDEVIFQQNELSELLPRPTPVSASLMEKLWAVNGSTHLACQRLGIPYQVDRNSRPYVNVFLGWLYVNKQEEQKRMKAGPGALASFQLSRNAEQIADQFQDEFLPGFKRRMDSLFAVDFNRLSLQQLVDTFEYTVERFVTETYVEAEVINIGNQFYWNTACAKLKANKVDPNLVLGKLPENVVSSAMNMLAKLDSDPDSLDRFIEFFGHRSPTDYELSHPRYFEDRHLVEKQAESLKGKYTTHTDPVLLNNKMLQIIVDRVRRFQALKEEAKHQCLREFSLIRQTLLALDRKCQLESNVFYLTVDEVKRLGDTSYHQVAREIARVRRTQIERFKDFSPPTQLTLAELEEYNPMANHSDTGFERSDALSGNRIAGQGAVSGVVHVIRDESEVERFREGEILVARMTDPSWYPLFPIAKGIITEVGGWLSHAAIVAREYDLPAIVGVDDATRQLRSGDIITMHTDGTIERLEERREPDSPMRVSVPAAVAARNLAQNIITDPNVIAMPEQDQNDAPEDTDDQKKAG
jgi:rhodanese-related sulfurtransferase/phosphohistidine swiveling domain-containing protein